jgi:dTDP-4-amino-4,6-dideoxygalactose transaminase
VTIPLFKVNMAPEAWLASKRVLESGYVGQGPMVNEFEQRFAEATGLDRPPLGVNSCSAAIDLALHVIGVSPGDEVITTPITCSASNGPIVTRGAKIVWADVDPLTGCIDPRSVARLVTNHTKAVLAVDWGGRSCDYTALRAAVGQHNWIDTTSFEEAAQGRPSKVFGPFIPIIQDAAH